MLTFPENRTLVMGVLNVTPDSFSDGGQFVNVEQAVAHAQQMVLDGADIIDIGGESSRPGAATVSIAEECARVVPVITRLSEEITVPISIDTYKPEVARKALEAGAHIVNDITGLESSDMAALVAEKKVPIVIMHMQGKPQTMQANPTYSDVIQDICTFFQERIERAHAAGVLAEQIILDPGIGFGKTVEHNLTILKRLKEFVGFGYPVLVGASRKSFIEKITGLAVGERVEASIAAHVAAVMNGARIVRVHDVQVHKRALAIIDAIQTV